MPPIDLASLLQLVLALGLINVWLLRRGKPTAYRGGSSTTLQQEFADYGLPDAVFFVVGALKLGAAAALLAGLWIPELALPAASVLAVLMLGAIAMHIKIQDPFAKSVPALSMLAMTATLAVLKLA
ncbi:MAG: DoxX family protein [Planctomycetes bacterium]|nr:DoxX family protein [Planctomycetota bacterium]